jgi:uncharacterized membrane protein YkvA (DUF1232 family)
MNKPINQLSGENLIPEEYFPDKEYSQQEISELSAAMEKKLGRNKKRIGFIRHLNALKNYLLDKNIKWYRKSVVVAALIYFITPIDSLPDFTPILGYLDDLGVIAWTVRFLGNEIRDYYG